MRGFLALGDSYTIGEGVSPGDRWPDQLTARLRERGFEIGAPEIIARTAWTTDELADAIARAAPAGPFPFVTLLIGVNDQYRGRTVESFAVNFASLLEQAGRFADGDPSRVIVLSIPDWGAAPFAEGRDRAAIADEIDAFNAAAHEAVLARGASWVDVTEASRASVALPALVAADRLHPSGEMYRRWVELILPLVARLL